MAHQPSRHGGSYPPPLFRAELDASQSRNDTPMSPDGTPIFEMPAEAAPPRTEQKRRPRVESPLSSTQANPWPFYPEEEHVQSGSGSPGNEKAKEEEKSKVNAQDELQSANPWPYHGPPPTETDKPSATIYTHDNHVSPASQPAGKPSQPNSETPAEKPAEIQLWPPPRPQQAPEVPPVPHTSRPPDSTPSSAAFSTDHKSYAVPLRLNQPKSPKAYMPYSPPLDREDEYVRPGASPPLSAVKNKAPMTYRPYRPPEDEEPQSQAYHSKPGPSISHPASPVGQPYDIPAAAPGTYTSYRPPSANDQSQSPGPPPHSTRPSFPQKTSTPVSPIESPPPWHPPQPISPVATGLQQQNLPPSTSSNSMQAGTMSYTHPPPPPVQPSHTGSSQSHHGSRPSSRPTLASPVSPVYSHPGSPHPISSSGSPHHVPQATYANPVSPAHSVTSQQSYSTAPPPQPPRPHMPHSTTEPFPTSHQASPPPPYSAMNPHNTFPVSSSSPNGAPLHQANHPTQPTYATTDHIASPQLPGGLAPPPLPPRPSSAQGHIPMTGFGSAASNASMYPPPPKTQYNPQTYKASHNYPPPPSGPPRPGAGKLFSGSSAKKWLDKTNHVLESTLAPIIQGPSTYTQQGHRPAPPNQSRPPQAQGRGQPHHGPRGGYPQGPPGAYPTGPPPMPARRP